VQPRCVTFVGLLNACASVGAIDVARHAHKQIIESSLKCLWGIALFTWIPNVEAWRMLGECSTSCPCVMWSLGMP
jgi:hypothetical protein